MHRLRDVLDALFADVVEDVGQPVADVVAHGARDADAAGLRQCLEPRCNVDTVAVYVVPVGDHVAEIDPDPEGDAFVLGLPGIAVDHRPLYLDGAPHRIDHTRKFHQHAIAGGLDDAAAMLPDLRVDELAAVRFQAIEGAFLFGSHQARVTGHIGREDRRKATISGHICAVRRDRTAIPDAALTEYAPLGHPVSPAFVQRWLSASNNIGPGMNRGPGSSLNSRTAKRPAPCRLWWRGCRRHADPIRYHFGLLLSSPAAIERVSPR